MKFDFNINIKLPEQLLKFYEAQTAGAKLQAEELKNMIEDAKLYRQQMTPPYDEPDMDEFLDNIPNDIGLISPEELFRNGNE